MKMTQKIRLSLRLQNLLFYVLLFSAVVLLAKITVQYNIVFDWTENKINTLSETSQQMLRQLDKPVKIQVFAGENYGYKHEIETTLDRYQSATQQLSVEFIDPALEPELVRALNIRQPGEMVISQGDRQEHVFGLSEQAISNALMAVSRQKQPWIVFIEGHGERSPFGQHNFNLSNWAEQLKNKGFKLQAINLIDQKAIPTNTAILVIASAIQDWLPGEIALVEDYLAQGGNLLWLAEPNETESLNRLAEFLGLELSHRTVLDPNAIMLGVDDPRFVLVSDYANHPIGQAASSVTLLAEATTIEPAETQTRLDWSYTNLLNSQVDAWLESEPVSQNNVADQHFNADNDLRGPLPLGYLLTRSTEDERQQRIVVIGDGDFVSNAYLGNGANLPLAMATANWLAEDDSLVSIPVKPRLGSQLILTQTQSILIGFGFLLVLPALLLLTGTIIWWRRRQR